MTQFAQRVAQGAQHGFVLGVEGINVAVVRYEDAVVHPCSWDHLVCLQQQGQHFGLKRRSLFLERDHFVEYWNDISDVFVGQSLKARLRWRLLEAWAWASSQRPDRFWTREDRRLDRPLDLR